MRTKTRWIGCGVAALIAVAGCEPTKDPPPENTLPCLQLDCPVLTCRVTYAIEVAAVSECANAPEPLRACDPQESICVVTFDSVSPAVETVCDYANPGASVDFDYAIVACTYEGEVATPESMDFEARLLSECGVAASPTIDCDPLLFQDATWGAACNSCDNTTP